VQDRAKDLLIEVDAYNTKYPYIVEKKRISETLWQNFSGALLTKG